MAGGSYSVPNVFGNLGTTAKVGLLDADFTYLQNGLNAAYQSGTLVNRPAAGSPGAYYFATDVTGGTLYLDNGTVWIQVSPSINANVLLNYYSGFQLSNDATSPNSVIDFTPGQWADSTQSVYITQSTIWTKSVGAWAAGTGNGMLDTGTIAAARWYHIFAISMANGASPDFLMSLSPVTPTMPGGYIAKRRIGSIATDGSANIVQFMSFGLEYRLSTPAQQGPFNNPGTSMNTLVLNGAPLGIKTKATFQVIMHNTEPSLGLIIYVHEVGLSDISPGSSFTDLTLAQNSAYLTEWSASRLQIYTNTASQINWRISSSTTNMNFYFNTIGWYDYSATIGQ